MTQDDAYRRNQSRRLHALYRRNRRVLQALLLIWFAVFAGLFAATALDGLAGLHWGLDRRFLWASPLALLFGVVFWGFARLILRILLGAVGRIYGPDPAGEA